jgi:hypothetical protein
MTANWKSVILFVKFTMEMIRGMSGQPPLMLIFSLFSSESYLALMRSGSNPIANLPTHAVIKPLENISIL